MIIMGGIETRCEDGKSGQRVGPCVLQEEALRFACAGCSARLGVASTYCIYILETNASANVTMCEVMESWNMK